MDRGGTYASPAHLAVDGRAVVAVTSRGLVALGAADGKELWQAPFPAAGGGGKGAAKAAAGAAGRTTPAARWWTGRRSSPRAPAGGPGRTGSGGGGDGAVGPPDVAAEFNTPVVKDGLVYGITARDELFCLDAKTGKTAWTTPVKGWNRPGYGSVVDAGTVLLALTPAGRLMVFGRPTRSSSSSPATRWRAGTYAYPVADGNRIFVKDKNAVTLWTTE